MVADAECTAERLHAEAASKAERQVAMERAAKIATWTTRFAAGFAVTKTVAGGLEADAHIVSVEDDEVHRGSRNANAPEAMAPGALVIVQ